MGHYLREVEERGADSEQKVVIEGKREDLAGYLERLGGAGGLRVLGVSIELAYEEDTQSGTET